MISEPTKSFSPQVKVCGLTRVDTALACVDLGVNAVGCVFFPKSPRFVSDPLAADICSALPPSVQSVGVFVNCSFSHIMEKVDRCGLTAVQLHGQESPDLLQRLKAENITVIKALFIEGEPSVKAASDFDASAFLVEAGKGALPGGNARQWDWSALNGFSDTHPLILAGGLTPENVADAISSSAPDAVDVSSGVESAPGIKDMGKVTAFMAAVSACRVEGRALRRVF